MNYLREPETRPCSERPPIHRAQVRTTGLPTAQPIALHWRHWAQSRRRSGSDATGAHASMPLPADGRPPDPTAPIARPASTDASRPTGRWHSDQDRGRAARCPSAKTAGACPGRTSLRYDPDSNRRSARSLRSDDQTAAMMGRRWSRVADGTLWILMWFNDYALIMPPPTYTRESVACDNHPAIDAGFFVSKIQARI